MKTGLRVLAAPFVLVTFMTSSPSPSAKLTPKTRWGSDEEIRSGPLRESTAAACAGWIDAAARKTSGSGQEHVIVFI